MTGKLLGSLASLVGLEGLELRPGQILLLPRQIHSFNTDLLLSVLISVACKQ